jgi:hypothetical protein
VSDLLWKATRPDGTTRNGLWWTVGEVTTHPTSTVMVRDDASTYLSLSAQPGETLIGGEWPCRLFRVEPLGDVITSDEHAHKRCVLAARVVEEVPAHLALGPMGVHVAALIARAKELTEAEARKLGVARSGGPGAGSAAWHTARSAAARSAAWDGARSAAWSAAARSAAWSAAWYATGDAAGYAAGYAAGSAAWSDAESAAVALAVRDLIGAPEWDQDAYNLLTGTWAQAIGPVHPDDAPVRAWTEETP